MSFIGDVNKGETYAPGWFLAVDECIRKTREISAANAVTEKGGKVVKMGTVYPANDSTAEGIVYEDVDVTTGNMPGSVVLSGTVYKDRLAVTLDSSAKTALEAKGFKFIDSVPAVTRPY